LQNNEFMKTQENQAVSFNMLKIIRLREIMSKSGITIKDISVAAGYELNINTLRRIFQGDKRYYTSDDFPQRLHDIENTLICILKRRVEEAISFIEEIENRNNPLGL